jgi:hypothetical protein
VRSGHGDSSIGVQACRTSKSIGRCDVPYSGMTGDVYDTLLRAIAEEECDDINDVPITYNM